MSTLITTGASTIAPTQLLGYSAAREAQSILHPILGRPDPDVTLRPAAMRTGTLSLGFAGATSDADSKTAADLLASAAVFNLADTDRASIGMRFVVSGVVTRELEEETRNAWIVSFGFAEVLP